MEMNNGQGSAMSKEGSVAQESQQEQQVWGPPQQQLWGPPPQSWTPQPPPQPYQLQPWAPQPFQQQYPPQPQPQPYQQSQQIYAQQSPSPQQFKPQLPPQPQQTGVMQASISSDSTLPKASLADMLYALGLVIFGFFYWDWALIWGFGNGFGTTVFFLGAIIMSFFYLRAKGIQQNRNSWMMLLVAVAGSLPFALNGYRDINPLLVLFEIAACLLWVMYSCRSFLAEKLSGLLLGDLFNQAIIVPFANFSRLFTRPAYSLQGDKKKWASVLFAVLGLIVCIPVFAFVITLLSRADDGFYYFFEGALRFFNRFDFVKYAFEFVFGLPVAAYIFGSVFGNVFKRNTAHLSSERLMNSFHKAHALPSVALSLPLVLFALLYIVFFIAMGGYLFSGLQGQLPVTYTYAEYARQGFFELCGVASINLIMLSFVWLLAKRNPNEHPLVLRILSGLLAVLTCMLIITAMSKMLLYIQTYNLTPLRIYTSWFMVFMLLVFLVLVTWHIRPFNAARPIIALIVVFTLGLGLINTNAIIANYNVDRYLAGQTTKIDTDQLNSLGDPAIPALYRLADQADDNTVRDEAIDLITKSKEYHREFTSYHDFNLTTLFGWHDRNLQSLMIDWLYANS